MNNRTITPDEEERLAPDRTPDESVASIGTDCNADEQATATSAPAPDTAEEESSTPNTATQPKAHNDEEMRPNLSLRDFLGGDILARGWIRRQMGLFVLLVVLTLLYITNRYSAEQELLEIDTLKKEYEEIKYRALTRSSELTERSRQSQLEQMMRHTADSVLTAPKEAPFKLHKPAEE